MLIHPSLVHFPIAFYVLEFFFLGLYAAKKDSEYRRFALIVFRFAFVSGLLAMAAGVRDAGGIAKLNGEVLEHALLALALFGWNILRAVYWRIGREGGAGHAFLLLAGAAVSVILTLVTGFAGGELVYD